jgi:superfamily II DNA/RNA helicase
MLAEKLYNLKSFQRQYTALITLSVCNTMPELMWEENNLSLLEKIDWNNMIEIASALSYSDQNIHLDSALRIAQTTLIEESTSKKQKEAAAIILKSLTNKPAINLAINRNLISSSYKDDMKFSLKLHDIKSTVENSILINEQPIFLNRFQKTVYDSYLTNDAISISAPTSSGKSFILCNIVLEELLKKKCNIVYVVPTRALISQVEGDLSALISVNKLTDVNISTVPQSENELGKSNILVFTQERLHWFLIENKGIQIDSIIFDEAQKIEDGYRGILLQQKLEEVVSKFPGVKVYFSSPFTDNPEILLESINKDSKKDSINTQFVSVNQNLIYTKQVPGQTDLWSVSLSLPDKIIKLGEVRLADRPTTEKKKVVFLLNSISGNNGGNIIYCNGAAETEKIASLICSILPDDEYSKDIIEFIKLVKKTIHKDYALANTLSKGVAFHYGNMPLLIRQEIERLFKEGLIKYLLCTSTLLEGVNLPAQTIYIRKPTRGPGHPLNRSDFWNLAGRAGRWGKEFSGNIVCIEPSKWEVPPSPIKEKQKIIRAIDEVEKEGDELIEFIKNGSDRREAENKQNFEFAFGYYYNKFLGNNLDENKEFDRKLTEIFSEIKPSIKLPDYIIKRNPGISPIAQQGLLDYFQTKIDDVNSLIPVYPEDDNALDEYTKLVARIGKTISKYPYQLSRSRAVLLINWMLGRPLAYLIKSSYASYNKSGKLTKKLPTIIREVMSDVENFARFRFAKDSSCYIDILRYFLEINNCDELLNRIPQLNLWLEFGVSQKTHLSLLSIGLSRNTVIELSEYITNSEMTRAECVDWIKKIDYEKMELSPIIIEDINKRV